VGAVCQCKGRRGKAGERVGFLEWVSVGVNETEALIKVLVTRAVFRIPITIPMKSLPEISLAHLCPELQISSNWQLAWQIKHLRPKTRDAIRRGAIWGSKMASSEWEQVHLMSGLSVDWKSVNWTNSNTQHAWCLLNIGHWNSRLQPIPAPTTKLQVV
jgi:hypothetical protein